MKKHTLIAMLFASTCALNAQTELTPRFTIGTRGGFGHSYIKPEGSDGLHGSWFIGLTTNYQFSDHFGFGADALYSSEGGRLRLLDGTLSTAEIDYLRVPLRFTYAWGHIGDELRPRIALAPTFGINMADNTAFKDMDFGLQPSVGLNYELLESFWLGADVAWYMGMKDIYAATSAKERNGNIRLELSLTFGL